jgi:hypothetical protein
MSRYQIFASEYDYSADEAEDEAAAIERVWDDAEQMLDDMTPNEMLDHLEHEFMDKALKQFDAIITKNRIGEDYAAEFAMQQARNDKTLRHEMILELAERLVADTV